MRRRPTIEKDRSLEMLGEYLICNYYTITFD